MILTALLRLLRQGNQHADHGATKDLMSGRPQERPRTRRLVSVAFSVVVDSWRASWPCTARRDCQGSGCGSGLFHRRTIIA